MSIFDTIAATTVGNTKGRVLEACRLEVGGFDAFGIEAIGDAFRRDPIQFDEARTIWDLMHFAAIADNQALFADLYDGNIGRIWRVGRSAPHEPEPFVLVPFGPDLGQAGGDVAFAPADHPALAKDAHIRVRDAGQAILDADPAAWRSRVFCIRAFGTANRGAALFALYRMNSGRVRAAGFGYAITLWNDEQLDICADVVPGNSDGRVRIAS